MSHLIEYKGNGAFWVNNAGFDQIVDLLLARAGTAASTPAEHEDVVRFRDMHENGELWAGRCFDLKEDFHELESPAFWSDQLIGLAKDVLDKKQGGDWQTMTRLGMITHCFQWSYFFNLRSKATKELGA